MTRAVDTESAAGLERATARILDAAHEAARFVATGYRTAMNVEHKGAVDLVTRFDRESEERLRASLDAAFPGVPVVGEEAGGEHDAGEPAFFVDPLDGTTNFVHGHPFWCVSVGLTLRGLPLVGVVVAPALGIAWTGYASERGDLRVATRHAYGTPEALPSPCGVSTTDAFEGALLATGFPYDRMTNPDNNFDAFVAIKRECQAVRRCGSAALDLCLVADGTYEGYWERRLRPWDLAGGAAIVRAAGGLVTDYEGSGSFLRTGNLVASNSVIHEGLLARLARVKAGAP